MTALHPPIEVLLREALDRLDRQEERTAALEAALAEATSHALTTTPTRRNAETHVAPWPRREPPGEPESLPQEPPAPPFPDAAARRELEARLAAAERRADDAETWLRATAGLTAAGRMMAGVAHDFNNLLGVIVGNADLVREAIPPDHPHREAVEAIAAAAHAAAGVTRQLLVVGKPGRASAGPLDVSAAVRTLEPTLRRLTGQTVPLELELAAGLPLVRADAGEFDRVVLNLVLNARDAATLGDGGSARGGVSVRTSLAVVEPGRAGWPSDRPPGEYLALTVTDTGCGMPPEVRARMFDLFFSTKGQRGTGLGLASVKDVVLAAGGHVEVESEVGWGTTVRVYWPPMG
jgi:signal transduction histidine kinase